MLSRPDVFAYIQCQVTCAFARSSLSHDANSRSSIRVVISLSNFAGVLRKTRDRQYPSPLLPGLTVELKTGGRAQ